MNFRKISDISSLGSDLSEALYLTLDIDWACDDVWSFAIDAIEKADVPATWFITHASPLLARLRENPKFELGIHPNFNQLINEGKGGIDAFEVVIDQLLEIVPEATSVRSHGMTQSSYILDAFAKKGLLYDCNTFVPHQSGIALKPWKHWNSLTKVPYLWEDDIACIYADEISASTLVEREGLKVFNFHPIHIFLNTENMSRYEDTRQFHHDAIELSKYRFTGTGTNTFLDDLLDMA